MAITFGEIDRFPEQALQNSYPRLQAHRAENIVVLFTGQAQGFYLVDDAGNGGPGALYGGSATADDANTWVPCVVKMADGPL